mgnify:CR=1 FL=1|jgi:hypothetical protein
MLCIRLNLNGFLTVIGTISVMAILLCKPAQATDPGPTVEDLLQQFDVIIFGEEAGHDERSDKIIRWEQSLRIRVVGEATALNNKILRRHANTLQGLTNRSIRFVTGTDEPENVRVVFVAAMEMANLPGVPVDQKMLNLLAAPRGCYFLSFPDQHGEIGRSIIVVNAERDTESTYHCLLEELIQSMGIPNDSDLIRPSVFSDKDKLTKITRSDEVLIRTLYDPRMRTGMDKTEALDTARIVITDWVARIPPR